MMPVAFSATEEEAMCRRSARDYDLHARTPSRPAGKPARSLVEVLRDLFRPRRPQVREAEVVPFPGGAAPLSDEAVDREGPKAA
jgi:hypothetical protein